MSYGSDSGGPAGPREARSGLDGLRRSAAVRGPADPVEDHDHANDHLALVYEDRTDQFQAVVPFVRQGLERGERVVYVADDNDTETVLAVLRDAGVDVDDARDADALVVTSPANTYRRTGEFDRDAMLDFWRETLADARADGFAGLRAAAEMTWALDGTGPDEAADVAFEDLVAYEELLNSLYEGDDYVVLCQYNRERFPAEVVDDVIEAHPHLVCDGTVVQNVYYTPPAEFVDERDPASDVDRKLRTLRERTEAKTALRDQQAALRALYETTADTDRRFEEKLQNVLDLGCEHFDMELGGIARVDVETDRFEVAVTNCDCDSLAPGESYPLSETYCQAAVVEDGTHTVTDPQGEGQDENPYGERFGVRSYIGTHLPFESGDDRTFWFVSGEARPEGFTEAERTFHHLMGQWVRHELERRQYERDLEATVQRLRQSNDRLKQFAYAASHDLQEPLRMVSSYLQLLESEYAADLDDDAREYIDFAIDGADRMRAMVEDLLAFSRVEHAPESFDQVDSEAVLDRVTTDLAPSIDEGNADVVVGSLPTVVADAEQLELLFRNLVSNAVKYGGDGPTRVEITAECHDDHWKFAVIDDGIGIDPRKTDRIFELFKRLHHDEEYSGTGIGLALCQEIVENHDGYIWVESEPGEGSTFSFTLPRREGE